MAGLTLEDVEKTVAGIELSRFYPPSAGNEANYQTFRRHLDELSAEYPGMIALEERLRELLLREHAPNASADLLAEHCLKEQSKADRPFRKIYQNTPFQLMRADELTADLEKKIFDYALATETCARWFGMSRKVDELFSVAELEEGLQSKSDREIRKAFLKSLVDRGLVGKALELHDATSAKERDSLFRCLSFFFGAEGREVIDEEAHFWTSMFNEDPLLVLKRGLSRVEREPDQFSFLLPLLREYFFAHVHEPSGEFLLGPEPVLPPDLLQMILVLDEDFDLEIWKPAACYGGYQIIDTDYQNGYKCGSGTGKNFPVSEYAAYQLKEHGIEVPSSIPESIPVPYRDPRDR